MAVVRNLIVRGGADFSGMRKELAKASSDLQKFKGSINKTVAGIGAALAGIGAGMGLKSATNDAIKFEALMGTLSRTLGNSMGDFIAWQKTVGKTMGFSKLQVTEMGNDFSLRLRSIAKDEQDLLKKTTDLIRAAAVIRSNNGMEMIEISDRMRSAMNQEQDGAAELGIDVRVSAIQQSNAYKMLANNAPWAELSMGMQKTILYQHILETTTRNFGTTIANNTALLKGGFVSALSDTKLALGQAFLPILNIALPLLTRLARMAEAVFIRVAGFMRALFPKSNIAAGSATTSAIDTQSGAVGGLGDAYKDAGAAATDAGKAAKKAAGSVAGFDEVNILAEPKAADDAGADAAGAGDDLGGVPGIDMGGFEKSLEVDSKVKAMAEKFKNMFKGMNIDFKPLTESFERLKTAIAPLTAKLFDGLKWAWENILVPLGKWSIEEAIPAFLDAVAGALTVLNPVLTAFQSLGKWLWDNFLKPIAAWTGGAIVTILKDLGAALTTIGTWMSNNQTTVNNVTKGVAAFFAAWKVIELLAFIQTSGGVVAAFGRITAAIWAATGAKAANLIKTAALKVMYAKDLVVAVAAASVELVKNAAKWTASTVAMGINKAAVLAGTIAQWAMTAATIAWNVAAGIGAAVTTAFGVAVAILTSPITLVIAAIALLVVGIILLVKHWDEVKEAGKKAWDLIKAAWAIAAKWMDTNVITPIAKFFTGLWDGIKDAASTAWTGIKETFGKFSSWMQTNVIAPVANLYLGLFNGIIDGVNWVIRALNKIKIDVPDWVEKVAGFSSFGINIPEIKNIPALAKGGITNGEMIAKIGDNPGGQEVVSPLSDLLGMVQNAVNMAMNAGNNSGSAPQGDIVLQVEGQTFARLTNPFNAKETKRIGGSMITVG